MSHWAKIPSYLSTCTTVLRVGWLNTRSVHYHGLVFMRHVGLLDVPLLYCSGAVERPETCGVRVCSSQGQKLVWGKLLYGSSSQTAKRELCPCVKTIGLKDVPFLL